MNEYVYVVVRTDLTPSQAAVQACHAVLEAGRSSLLEAVQHPHLVLCGVRNESALAKSLNRIKDAGIACQEFKEPDIGNQLTAFATKPVSGDSRRLFKSFKLYNPEPSRPTLFSRLAGAFTHFFSRKETTMTTATATEVEVFESRWGFHPCDYQTFRKLRFLKKCWFETQKAKADWERWVRKEPQNRVIRRWKRDENRRKIGHEVVGPRPEPKVCPYFDGSFLVDCEIARMPRDKGNVTPLRHTIEQINQQYYKVKGWFEEN